MTFIPINGCAKVSLNYTFAGELAQNTLAFVQDPITPNIPSSELDALCEAVYLWWQVNMAPLIANTVELRNCEAVDLTGQYAAYGAHVPVSPASGSLAKSLPNNVTICVSFRTASRGRRARGRVFLPGVSEDRTSGPNAITAAHAGNVLSAFNQLVLEVNNNTSPTSWKHVIASRAGGIGATYEVTEYAFSDRTLDSQRRRLPGRGS